MSKVLNPATLNESDRNYLSEVTEKDVDTLTVYEIGFLRARSAYLTQDQREHFADALSGKVKGVDFEGVDVEEDTAPKTGERKEINPDDYTRDVLIQMCKDAELKFDPKANKDVLAELLNNR